MPTPSTSSSRRSPTPFPTASTSCSWITAAPIPPSAFGGRRHVRPLWLPPYGPELNPIERVWRDLKDDLAWLQFPNLEAPQVYVGDLLQTYKGPPPSKH